MDALPEYSTLGVSIRTIAQRFSERHHGSKPRVKVVYELPRMGERVFSGGGKTPLSMTMFEEEIGAYVDLELNLCRFHDI